MTTCSECLSALSTARLADIGPGSAVALHAATCPYCTRAVEEVRYAEYRLASSLNEAMPRYSPVDIAEAAMVGSERQRRRRVARWIQGGLLVAIFPIIAIFIETRANRGSDQVTETISLRCMSGEAALSLVTPYLRSNGSVVYRNDPLRSVTIRADRREVSRVMMEIDRAEASEACQMPAPTPAPTSSETPEKD